VKGNAEFGHGQWELALGTYREGLGELPPRQVGSQEKGKGKATLENGVAEGEDTDDTATVGVTAKEEAEEESIEDKEISSLRAVLSANVAACLLKLVSTALSYLYASVYTLRLCENPLESMEGRCQSL